jgi:hypothetical protein
MNAREGVRRFGILLGVSGCILGSFHGYSYAQDVWDLWAANRRFESLMASPIMQKVAKVARDYQRSGDFVAAGELADYDASAGEIGPRLNPDQYRQYLRKIQQERSSGLSDDEIRGRMLWAGWKQEEVGYAMLQSWVQDEEGRGSSRQQIQDALIARGHTKDEIARHLVRAALRAVHVHVGVEGIAGVWVDKGGLVTLIEPSTGTPVEKTESLPFKAWYGILLYPILGFLLPWGGIRVLTWVGTGFSDAPRLGETTMGTESYRVFSALHEETDKGWVWTLLEEAEGFASRTTIKISLGRRSVYCEYRSIDENFVRLYDGRDNTRCIYFKTKDQAKHGDPVGDLASLRDAIIISDWYRKKLGGFGTTNGESGQRQALEISKPRWPFWADLRAACQHPEPGVRVATRVAILGVWLGVTGLLVALPEPWAPTVSVLLGVGCVWAGRSSS